MDAIRSQLDRYLIKLPVWCFFIRPVYNHGELNFFFLQLFSLPVVVKIVNDTLKSITKVS